MEENDLTASVNDTTGEAGQDIEVGTEQTEENQVSPEQPQAAVPEATKDGKPILDPENLPEDAKQKDKDYATQMMRYFTKRTQGIAEEVKKAKEYDRLAASNDWQEFQNWKNYSQQRTPQAQPASQVDTAQAYLHREYEDAVAAGDTARMLKVQEQMLDRKLAEKEKLYTQRLASFEKAQKNVELNMVIDEFGKLHPDFWDYHKAGIAVPILREMEQRGGTLEQAYDEMKKVASHFGNQYAKQSQARVQEKREAVSQTPTPPVESEFVEVVSKYEADRMNIQFAMEGSNKIARAKK
jgi:hypothetical protein